MDNVSVIIKTFERPHELNRLITSIKKFYPNIPILVADDSKQPGMRNDVEYYALPFDSGVSYGRNYLVDRVKTKYFITLDDDWEFTEETKLEEFVKLFETEDVDILAGSWVVGGQICVLYHIEGTTLTLTSVPQEERDSRFQPCDFTHQFFIAETERFKEFGGWDNELKTRGEHTELFLRAKKEGMKAAVTENVKIIHEPSCRSKNTDANYKKFRKRDFLGIAMKKHGITKYINFTGRERKF